MPANPTLLEPLPRNRYEVRRWFKRNTTRQERENRIRHRRQDETQTFYAQYWANLSPRRQAQITKAIYDGGDSVRKRKERQAVRARTNPPGI